MKHISYTNTEKNFHMVCPFGIHLNKLGAVMEMKLKALLSKNFIIMPVFAIGFTVVMKLVYGSIGGTGFAGQLQAYALSLGALMNITMTGIYCVSASLAEEKEKHTLRVLMTSSVNGLEFFLGSLLPVILLMLAVNMIIVPAAGVSMDISGWAAYMGITLLSAAASSVIGMIFGIFSKNQISAGTITTPALMLFLMIPMFSSFHPVVQKISDFLFTGILMETIRCIVNKNSSYIDARQILILLAEILLAVLCFLFIYKRNGYDSD